MNDDNVRLVKYCLSQSRVYLNKKIPGKKGMIKAGMQTDELAILLCVSDLEVRQYLLDGNIPDGCLLYLRKLHAAILSSANNIRLTMTNKNGYVVQRHATLHGLSRFDNTTYKFTTQLGSGWTDIRNIKLN